MTGHALVAATAGNARFALALARLDVALAVDGANWVAVALGAADTGFQAIVLGSALVAIGADHARQTGALASSLVAVLIVARALL